jgi:uncharacterized membrane protein YkvA (DUF1232 family)
MPDVIARPALADDGVVVTPLIEFLRAKKLAKSDAKAKARRGTDRDKEREKKTLQKGGSTRWSVGPILYSIRVFKT